MEATYSNLQQAFSYVDGTVALRLGLGVADRARFSSSNPYSLEDLSPVCFIAFP